MAPKNNGRGRDADQYGRKVSVRLRGTTHKRFTDMCANEGLTVAEMLRVLINKSLRDEEQRPKLDS